MGYLLRTRGTSVLPPRPRVCVRRKKPSVPASSPNSRCPRGRRRHRHLPRREFSLVAMPVGAGQRSRCPPDTSGASPKRRPGPARPAPWQQLLAGGHPGLATVERCLQRTTPQPKPGRVTATMRLIQPLDPRLLGRRPAIHAPARADSPLRRAARPTRSRRGYSFPRPRGRLPTSRHPPRSRTFLRPVP